MFNEDAESEPETTDEDEEASATQGATAVS
jgi:hypothetical protein